MSFEFLNVIVCDKLSCVPDLISAELKRDDLSFIYLNLSVNDELEGLKVNEVDNSKVVLIVLQSAFNDQVHFVWKNANLAEIFRVKVDGEETSAAASYVYEFLIARLESGVQVKKINILPHLSSIVDSNGNNLLIDAVTHKDIPLIRELLKFPFDINQENVDNDTAADIAWKSQNYEILLALLNANSKFPKNFSKDHAYPPLDEFVKGQEKMHAAVKAGSQLNIGCNNYPQLLHFYNVNNVSALNVSPSEKVYKTLIMLNCIHGPDEKVTAQSDDQRSHLMKIHQKIFFGANDDNQIVDLKAAVEMLNKEAFGKKLLELASKDDKLRIFVDIRQERDPSHIAGVIARQVCRSAMKMKFNNNGKPYVASCTFVKQQFKFILRKTESLTGDSEIVKEVYLLPKKEWATELFAAVPQMMMKEKNEEEKKFRNNFKDLFTFFDNVMNAKDEKKRVHSNTPKEEEATSAQLSPQKEQGEKRQQVNVEAQENDNSRAIIAGIIAFVLYVLYHWLIK